MIECLFLGDSIAVGARVHYPKCEVVGEVGINSKRFNQVYGTKGATANTVIISLGSNDHKGIKTKQELEMLRSKVSAGKVYWIVPAIQPIIQQMVREVANTSGDFVIEIKDLQSDKVHPTAKGYKQIIGEIK